MVLLSCVGGVVLALLDLIFMAKNVHCPSVPKRSVYNSSSEDCRFIT